MLEQLNKIGLNGLIIILLFLIYLLVAAIRPVAISFGICFLLAARLLQLIVGGFEFSERLGSVFGNANTVISFLMLSCAIVETIFFGKKSNWARGEYLIFFGLYVIGIQFLLWKIFLGKNLVISDFVYLAMLTVFIIMKPNIDYLHHIFKVSFLLISILFILAIFRYQNPYALYTETFYGVDGPYYNFMWDIFGLTERLRGPYTTPNVLAYNVVFIVALSFCFKNRLTMLVSGMGIVIILLSGSRISLFAISVLILADLYLSPLRKREFNRANVVESRAKKIAGNRVPVSIFTFLLLFVIAAIISKDPTLHGRTTNYGTVFERLNGNWVFGAGIDTGAENTLITLAGAYGLLGVMSIVFISAGMIIHFRKQPSSIKLRIYPLLFSFVIALMGESLLNGGPFDIGLLYIFVILTMRDPKSHEVA